MSHHGGTTLPAGLVSLLALTLAPELALASTLHLRRAVDKPWFREGDGVINLEQRYNAGYIVLSYCVAVIGAGCTLELLLKRTSNRGRWNILLLIGAGFSFGSVSTFAMHFIGNNSLTLHVPPTSAHLADATFTLTYSAGFTVLSLVVSVSCMILAFFVMGLHLDWNWFLKSAKREEDIELEGGEMEDVETEAFNHGKKLELKKAERKRSAVLKEGEGWSIIKAALAWTMVDLDTPESRRKSSTRIPPSKPGKGDLYLEEERERELARAKQMEPSASASSSSSAAPPTPLEYLAYVPAPSENKAVKEDSPKSDNDEDRFGSYDKFSSNSFNQNSLPRNVINPSFQFGSIRRGSLPQFSTTPSSSTNALLPPASLSNHQLYPIVSEPPTPTTPQTASSTSVDGIKPLPASVPPTYNPYARRASLPVHPFAVPLETGPSTFEEFNDRTDHLKLERIQSIASSGPDDQDPEDPLSDYKGARTLSQGDAIVSEHEHDSAWVDETLDKWTNDPKIGRPNNRRGTSFPSAQKAVKKKTSGNVSWSTTEQKWWVVALGLSDVTTKDVVKVITAGTVCGFGIAGMHYLGQASINSIPHIAYGPLYVVFSVVIACVAVVVALWIMFLILRPKLSHTYITRLAVAMLLGAATCCMHYCAMVGTSYAIDVNTELPSADYQSRIRTIMIALVASLAVVACAVLLGSSILGQKRRRAETSRRRRVVVAAAIFDPSTGQLLVTPEGFLPLCDVGSLDSFDNGRRRESSRSNWLSDNVSVSDDSSLINVDLSTHHPAFVAAVRSTWAWRQNPSNLLSTRQSIAAQNTQDGVVPELSVLAELAIFPNSHSHNKSLHIPSSPAVTSFLTRFTSAVSELSSKVNGNGEAAPNLGVLYDQILSSGYVTAKGSDKPRKGDGYGADSIGRGQVLFLTNQVRSAVEKRHYQDHGYIFAEPNAVARMMAGVLSLKSAETMSEFLAGLMDYTVSGTQPAFKPGKLYVSVMILQALPFEGLRIVADSRARHALPKKEICDLHQTGPIVALGPLGEHVPLGRSLEEVGEAIDILGGTSLISLMGTETLLAEEQTEHLRAAGGSDLVQIVKALRGILSESVIPLLDRGTSKEAMKTILCNLHLVPVLVPLAPPNSTDAPSYTIIFRAMLSASVDVSELGPNLTWSPVRLFRAVSECVTSVASAESGPSHLYKAAVSPGRRPSKVQFESFPYNMNNSSHSVATPTPFNSTGALSPFNSFAFPTSPPTGNHIVNLPDEIAPDEGPAVTESIPSSPRSKHRPPDLQFTAMSPTAGSADIQLTPNDGPGPRLGIQEWNPQWLIGLLREDIFQSSVPQAWLS